MKKMKVLFLTINLGNGGAEKVLVNLANAMAEDGYDITVRALSDTGHNRANLSRKVHYEFVWKKSFRGLNFLDRLPHQWIYNKVAHGAFDIIIAYLHGVLTRIVSYAPAEQKTIAWLHANMETSPFMKQFRDQQAVQRCFSGYDRIVSVSREVQESFIRTSGINDERLTVKYNTFDVEQIRKLATVPVPSGFQRKDIRLCSVGKLDSVKGYDRLLRVLKRLKADGFSVFLTIVGEGKQRKDLEDFLSENHLKKSVSLAGFDENPYKYMANSNLFICSSYSEGFSSVVAESLILGIPVLTTGCAGMREMLGDNEYGLIVENSEEALYEGLKAVLSDPALLEYYRQKAQERSAFFSVAQTVGAVEQMIEEVIYE